MQDFEHSVHSNSRLLPPSKAEHIEHIKRATFEAGWVAYQCKENVDLSSLELWDWKLTENGKFLPKWQEIENHIDPERLVTITCSCIKAKRSSCQCSRLGIGCITFFKCQRQCQYAPAMSVYNDRKTYRFAVAWYALFSVLFDTMFYIF